jgi:hypothetical protein
LTAAKATVTRATAQKNLTHAISVQAQTIAKEAARALTVQDLPLLIQSKLLKPMSRLKLQKLPSARWTKQQLRRVTLLMVQTPLTTDLVRNTKWRLRHLTNLVSHGSVTTPPLMSTLSSISMNQGIITQTPGTILPGNPYVRALFLLHHETAAVIQEINAPAADIPMESIKTMTPSNRKQGNIITVLKTLLNQGIVEPICQFHTCLVSNKQE